MNDERAALARLGLLAADDMDRARHPYAGVMRRLAQALAAAPVAQPPAPGRCGFCAGPLPVPGRGRPRLYCSPACRRSAHRRDEKRTK